MQPEIEILQERVRDAARALLDAGGTASFCLTLRGTHIFVAAGDPDQIRWLLPDASPFDSAPSAPAPLG